MTDTPLMSQDPAKTEADAQRSHGDNARLVAREGGWAGIFSLMGAFIRYGNNVILTRVLGADMFGLYALANTVVTVVTVPSTLGLPMSMVHFIASHVETERWDKLRWVVRASFRLVVFSSLVAAAVVLLLSPWAAHSVFKKDGLLLPLTGLALALPFLSLYLVTAGGLQGLKFIRGKVFIERIAHPLIFSVLLVAGALWVRSLEYVLVCYFVAAASVLGIGAYWFRKRLATLPAAVPAPAEWKHLLGFSTPVMFMQFLNFFIMWSDVLIMGVFRSKAEVGIYAIASRLAAAVSMPTDSLGASLAPSFSSLVGRADPVGLKRLFHTSTRWIFLLGTAICLGLVLGGLPVLHLFGKDFQAGYLPLCILAAGQMITATFGANGTLITMTGHPKVNLYNAIFMGVGNLGLNLYLVPRYGALGAASAAALSWTLVNVTRAVEIWFLLKIGPWDRSILKPVLSFLCGILLGGAVYHWVHPLPGAVVGLLAYAGMWRLLGPEAEDLDMLARAWARLRRNPHA